MSYLKIFLYLLIAFDGLVCFVDSEKSNEPSTRHVAGRDFIFAFANNAYGYNQLFVLVSNDNNATANVNVTSIYAPFRTIPLLIAPFTIENISVWQVEMQVRYGDVNGSLSLIVEDKGIRIQSSLPVSVYGHSRFLGGYSADSFTIRPSAHMGTEYLAVGTLDNIEYPNVAIAVAYEDNTTIQIGGMPSITLNALQVVSLSTKSVMSGIRISGNKPFAAFSGNMCGNMVNSDACGYAMVNVHKGLQTTLIPVAGWGTQFALVPFANVSHQQFQLIASANGTSVTVEYTMVSEHHVMNAGDYLTFDAGDASGTITSNYPIQVIQMGNLTDNYPIGAPFFLQLSSVESWSSTSVVFRATASNAKPTDQYSSFVRIYTKLADVGRIALDNVVVSALLYRRIAQSNYYYYEMQLSANATSHTVSPSGPNVTYSVVSYSYGFHSGSGFTVA